MKTHHLLKALPLVTLLLPTLAFATNYSEVNNGDLSNNRAAPTAFNLTMGTNTLTATTGGGANDEEYLKIVVPAMHNLASITLNSYSGAAKSFIGIQNGATFTVTPAAAQASDMLGYTLFGTTGNVMVNGNVLAAMSQGAGSTTFTPPLAANTYTIWIQETGGNTTYTMTFNVQANNSAQAPVLDPPSGAYLDSVNITMTTASAVPIYYTLDGSTPTAASTLYTGPITLNTSATVKAFAHDGVMTDSLVTTETYTVTPSPDIPAPTPTLTISGKKSLKSTKPTVKIKGTATNATAVTYHIGKGATKTANGTGPWSFNAKLKPGKNVITITAEGEDSDSAPQKVTVIYKKN